MIHLIHPSGNAFVRALLEELEILNTTYRYWTTIGFTEGRLQTAIPAPLRHRFGRRSYAIPRHRIATRPFRESVRLLAPALGLKQLSRHEKGWASVDAVYRDLDCAVAWQLRCNRKHSEQGSWVYAYEDGALESFRAAKERDMHRAYELPIAYWETSRRLLTEEALRWPAWSRTLVGPSDSPAKLERKSRELELADVIVVPSSFVARSLPNWIKPDQQIVISEFGSPVLEQAAVREETSHESKQLRVLFAGSMSQRKGLADVLEAIKLLRRSDVELVLMGSLMAPMEFYRGHGVDFVYEAPRAHEKVLELMGSCDVLVLPSIVEGRALVQQEALACGLPIIVTANAGGEDLVVEGETGFIVPVRSPVAIAEKIAWLADHRETLEISMRPACRAKAAEYTWRRYAARILQSLVLAGNC
jgi:glycosyltransferase involved in cell wall biosynthesis